jgi:hypothetical protein
LTCHGIANGNFGPKLDGVHETHPLEGLVAFVENSDAFVKKEDARTLALLDKYKNPNPEMEKHKAEFKNIRIISKNAKAQLLKISSKL